MSALDLSRSMVIRETEWRSLYGLAQLALKEGDRTEAKRLLLEAIDVIEGMRAAIKVEQLKDGFIDNKLSVYETLISLLVDMGDSKGAFEIAERCRSRNFIDLLGNQRLTLKSAIDQDLYVVPRPRRQRHEVRYEEPQSERQIEERLPRVCDLSDEQRRNQKQDKDPGVDRPEKQRICVSGFPPFIKRFK